MHDLSDGMAIIGPRSQAKKLSPPVDAENVQLRMDDARASITITPAGAITLEASESCTIKASQVIIEGNLTTTGTGGGAGQISMRGQVSLDGGMNATSDITAEGKSVAHHMHPGDSGGSTGEPS